MSYVIDILRWFLLGFVISERNIVNRFAGSSEGLNHWRYYIDAVEIHIPPLLVPYLQQENVLDVVCTPSIPIVVGVNGHFLKDDQNCQKAPSALNAL